MNSNFSRALKWASLALAVVVVLGCYKTVSRVLQIPEGERQQILIEMNVMVPMRDGVRLATDIYRPEGPGQYPTLFSRIPYGTDNRNMKYLGKYFARNNYVVVLQDTRGIQNSEGIFWPLVFEFEDGVDTVKWIAEQSWFNGKIGGIGGSYFGYTQWQAARENPLVTCMVPLFTSPTMHKIIFNGGVLEYIMVEGWLAGMEAQITAGEWAPDLETGYYNAPMREAVQLDMEEMKKTPELYSPMSMLAHPGDIYQQAPVNFRPYYQTVSAPSLNVAGWFDQFLQPQLEDFIYIREEGIGDARKSRLIVGPWVHGMPVATEFQDKRLEALRFFLREHLAWYDYWLKGIDNGILDEAPVKIFVMGENVWRDEEEWPLARTQYTDYYLHSSGGAAAYPGGRLSTEPPTTAQPPDEYDYDPKNPVPTRGGTFQPFTGWEAGSFDQSDFFERQDTLIYVTPPLAEGVEVTGPISVTLYASSSAIDTDFTAMLLDIHPDGKAMFIQDGAIRARYREGYDRGIPLVPGEVYEFELDLWSTSNLFLPGHRIGLMISSSNFPAYDRNTNAGGVGGNDNIIVARQRIYHSPEHPSRITLPVIPR